MRTFITSITTLTGALAVAVLTAACDGTSPLLMVSTPDHSARYTLVKDQQGRLVRFDPVTGEVRGLKEKKTITAAPVRTVKEASAVIVPAPAVATPIRSDELCSGSEEHVAVTLVDTGVYARPSIGTRMVGRVASGTLATIAGTTDDWVRVSLESPKGPLVGFVHCSTLRPLTQGPSE